MAVQGLVQVVQLLARRGAHDERQAHVVAALAGAHLDGRGVKAGVELQHDVSQRLRKLGMLLAHDLDGKVAGIFDKRFFGRNMHEIYLGKWLPLNVLIWGQAALRQVPPERRAAVIPAAR